MMGENKQTQPATYTEEEINAARQKSYYGHTVLVLVLYFVLYIPGLAANIIFWLESKRTEEIAGRKPPGKDLLAVLFGLFVVLPFCFLTVALFVGLLVG